MSSVCVTFVALPSWLATYIFVPVVKQRQGQLMYLVWSSIGIVRTSVALKVAAQIVVPSSACMVQNWRAKLGPQGQGM